MIVTLTFCALLAGADQAANATPRPVESRAANEHIRRLPPTSNDAPGSPSIQAPEGFRPLAAWGVRFRGTSDQLRRLVAELPTWISTETGWGSDVVEIVPTRSGDALDLRLRSRPWETDTLHLWECPQFAIEDDCLTLTSRDGNVGAVPLVSRKEILASLLRRGRLTEFSEECCTLQCLQDHLEIRRNIVRWSAQSDWGFPYWGFSKFNDATWTKDRSVQPGITSAAALHDFYVSPQPYLIGCRTSCKVQMMQGLFDFARRTDSDLLTRLETLAAGDPLAGVEPKYGGPADDEIVRPGKFLDAVENVPWNNWVAGDWGYVRNNDPESRKMNGNEGHNMVYLGRGVFAPNYRGEGIDVEQDRPLEKVLYYVYSWRGTQGLSLPNPGLTRILAETPERGGLLENQRFVPKPWPRRPTGAAIAVKTR